MRKSYLLGAFAILFTAMGSPALAQDTGGGPIGPGSRYGLQPQDYSQGYSYDQGYRGWGYDRRYYRDNGFNPVGAAGEVVGGAAQTAGAIATAPFRAFDNNDSYAMSPESSYCAERYRSYDPASGTFMGYDGRRHPCR